MVPVMPALSFPDLGMSSIPCDFDTRRGCGHVDVICCDLGSKKTNFKVASDPVAVLYTDAIMSTTLSLIQDPEKHAFSMSFYVTDELNDQIITFGLVPKTTAGNQSHLLPEVVSSPDNGLVIEAHKTEEGLILVKSSGRKPDQITITNITATGNEISFHVNVNEEEDTVFEANFCFRSIATNSSVCRSCLSGALFQRGTNSRIDRVLFYIAQTNFYTFVISFVQLFFSLRGHNGDPHVGSMFRSMGRIGTT